MNRNNNFVFCHFIGAILVIYGHQWDLMDVKQRGGVLGLSIHGAGVYILFAISGYLIAGSYKRANNVKSYIQRRIDRIFLPLLLCLIFTGILGYILRVEDVSAPCYLKGFLYYFIRNIFFLTYSRLPGVFTQNPYAGVVNGSLWSLAPEMLCYILVPVLLKKGRGERKTWILLGLLVCSLSYYMSYHGVISIKRDSWLAVIICFLIGICINAWQLEKYCNLQVAVVAGIISACCGNMAFYPILNMFVICYIAMSLCLVDEPILSDAIKADINYELYLYAFPIQQTLIYLFIVKYDIRIPVFCMFVLSLSIIVVISIMMNGLCRKLKKVIIHICLKGKENG